MRMKTLLGMVGILVSFGLQAAAAQEMMVTDSDANVLMQVNDEGDAGSLTLPPAPAAPADNADKLHNVNGVLYWQDAQLGTGWTRTGSDVHLTNPSDNVGIGIAAPTGGARLEVAGQVKITGGSPGADRYLVSDPTGLANWQDLEVRIEDAGDISTVEIGPDSVANISGRSLDYSIAIGKNARAGSSGGVSPGLPG